MSEKRVLTVKCPKCSTTLQVKTRSVEKTVACPKCQASMTVSVAPAPAPEQLPFAMRLDAPQASMPMAESLALPFAQPLATSPRRSRRHFAIAGGVGGAVLVAVTLVFVFRSGSGPLALPVKGYGQPNSGASGATVGTEDTVTALEEEDKVPAVAAQSESESNGGGQGGNLFEALSNSQIKAGANNPANNFPQGGFQQGGGFPSVGNTQQRDWDLANGGRLGAMGLKKVQVPRR